MKHHFRTLIGMLALALPLCLNAQVEKPVRPEPKKDEPKKEELRNIQRPGEGKDRPEPFVQHPDKPEPPRPGMDKPMPGGPEMKGPHGDIDKTPKISGFVQGLYQANFTEDFDLKDNTLRMRRVRMSVEGKLSKTVSYKIQGDFSRSPMMVDAFLKYKPCNEFAIQVGQFKTPFTLESPINPVNLEIFDYGESVQKLVGYGDVCGVGGLGRDIGIMATGNFFPVEGKDFSLVTYSLGVFNGNGPCTTDNNNPKDIAGRLEVHPMMKDLTLSGSFYHGQYKSSTDHGARNRWSAGAQYNDGDLLVRAEYLNGNTGRQVAAIENELPVLDEQGNPVYVEELYNSKGYYAVAGYNLKLGKGQKLMPVLRYEHFTSDASIENGGTNWYTVGLNYWPMKSVNFKLDYSLVQKETGTNSHRVVGILSYKF